MKHSVREQVVGVNSAADRWLPEEKKVSTVTTEQAEALKGFTAKIVEPHHCSPVTQG
jgi:hypothetical protein